MAMKTPGSAPDKMVEWSVLILFLFSDLAHATSVSWQCPEHLELKRGGEGCSLGVFVLRQTFILHLQTDLAISF